MSLLPEWAKDYSRSILAQDGAAALIVTLMLIPQSLAYAMLAGLPPQAGLYASILPLIIYALSGSSRTLSVGPVAVLSLMTAATLGQLSLQGVHYTDGALALALLSGGWLLLFGLFRLGFVAHFISHSVMSGFISASAVLITLSQLRHLLGVQLEGALWQLPVVLVAQSEAIPPATLGVSVISLIALLWARAGLKGLLLRIMSPASATAVVRLMPALVVMSAIVLSVQLDLESAGVAVVQSVPAGLPVLSWPEWHNLPWRELVLPSLLLGLVGFVESVSIGQTLAARRRQRIRPNRELIGLGLANLSAGVSGGMPVTGGFARSVVNFDAGAQTPAAGIYAAFGITLAGLWFAPWLSNLPQAVLAATIVVSVLGLFDWRHFGYTWRYSRADFSALCVTFIVTLTAGVEIGLVSGILVSLLLHLYHSHKPHWAEVGRIAGTEHFRNRLRHRVELNERLLCLRIDESLYFANAGELEEVIATLVSQRPGLRHLVLQCTAVNRIDASALDSLLMINERLRLAGICFHLAEVKGPVMDRLERSELLRQLSGKVYLTLFQAWQELGGS
ncbi:SulP family inorganic anion transporter [Oceanimonas sp. CAM02]|uniref:SulP family inorganic anion transporter n=1 Tax=Oceanimonas sp. CAM02 TaxID=3080336 RepID=UPI0029364822|nr:SulP family inorganic anion transporter [Oceanimonas sp. CAM02]MDV2857048.1 SulP family inorganic anion transporter [Oceanimonas sp. CAM02]